MIGPFRSLLFIPGNRKRMLEHGPTTAADALILDLEDAVPHDEKDLARRLVARQISTTSSHPIFVRVNAPSTELTRLDLEAIVGHGLAGVFVPKVDTPEELAKVAGWIDDLEESTGTPVGQVEIVCMIETAGALRRAYELALANSRVAALSCSSAQNGDLQVDLGCDWSTEGTELLYARSKIVVDSRAAGLVHPLDGVYAGLDDLAGLIVDTNLSKRLGYRGRAVIHPSHIDEVNRIYSPTPETIAYCKRLLIAFDAALLDSRASVAFEGNMIDFAMAAWARKTIDQAAALGIGVSSSGLVESRES